MSHPYSPRNFLRQVPIALLGQYFTRRSLLAELPWDTMTDADIDTIYPAWQSLPSERRESVELDFRDIHDLAYDDGIKALVE